MSTAYLCQFLTFKQKVMEDRGLKQLTFSLTASETVRDSMRHDTVQARMWNRVYIRRVLVDDLMGGQQEQQSEQGAGPQQQHICSEERGTGIYAVNIESFYLTSRAW